MTHESRGTSRLTRTLYLLQGIYYLITGLWPIIHLPSFEKISGPKRDKWLVKTVGIITAVIGLTLCLAGLRETKSAEPVVLAIGEAAAFTAVDTVFVAQKRISPVYLLDAFAQIMLIAAWAIALLRDKKG